MPRPIEALVHRDALAANLEVARSAAAGARVWAVVKANAYGHGIAQRLRRPAGRRRLRPARPRPRPNALRALGWRGPILLLEGCFEPRDLETCSRLNLWHTVHCEAQIDMLAAHKTDRPHRVFLKMNSGMNRLGFAPGAIAPRGCASMPWRRSRAITLMTHLANADAADAAAIEPALAAFEAATHDLPGERSICNSAATLRFGAAPAGVRGDWVRPGILLYGSSPDHPAHSAADWGLQPAMSLRSELIAVQTLAPGDASATAAASPPSARCASASSPAAMPTAIRASRRAATSGTPVLVDGVRTRTVGRVSMDMITVDLTPVPRRRSAARSSSGAAPTTAVLPIDEVAQAAGTVGYELMCARAPRVPVRVVAP